MKIFYIIVACVLLLGQDAIAQKVKYRPLDFNRPFAYNLDIERNAFENEVHDAIDKKNKSEWYVVSDQNDNPVYESKNTSSKVMARLKFRDICYVTEDNTAWLKIALEANGGLEEIGWIPKANVLQWNSGLLDAQTEINLKGFVLNNLNNFKEEELKSATLFDGPQSKESIGSVTLHDFYFVYKIHYSENGKSTRYLISSDNILSKGLVNDLKGWVDAERITEWNTRLSLEPNFTEEAYNERKTNPNYHINGFMDKNLTKRVTSGSISKIDLKKVIWAGDPSTTSKGVATNSQNPRRLLGEQIRFPIIGNYKDYYKSGILASLANQSNNALKQTINIPQEIKDRVKRKAENINVIFVMEGSSEVMKQHAVTVKLLADKIINKSDYKKAKISVGVYKDTYEKNNSDYFKLLPSTSDVTVINNFLGSIYWGKNGDYDELTCWKYGLYKSITGSNLSDDATNVVVLLGNYADLSVDFIRKDETDSKYLVDKNNLRDLFSKYEIHWITANVEANESAYSEAFNDNIREYIHDFTKEICFDYTSKIKSLIKDSLQVESIVNIKTPTTPRLSEGNLISTKDFITKNLFLRAPSGESLSPKELQQFVSGALTEIKKQSDESASFVNSNNSIDISNNIQFSETSLNIVRVALNRINQRMLKPEELKAKIEAVGDTRFFHTAYLAKKQPNQVYDPFSLVLFMPHNDLENYVDQIGILSHYLDLSPDQAREQMQKFLQELGKQFTGGEDMNIINDLEIEDILNLFLGVEKEGYKGLVNLKETSGCKLKYLDNSRKCKDEDIQRFGESIINATQKLKSILVDKPVYEYKYKSNGNKTYYWIPVEYMY